YRFSPARSFPMRPLKLAAALMFFALAACASNRAVAPEKLYFAVEVKHDGKVVGKPKLLGETGKSLKIVKRAPGEPASDYELTLYPLAEGDRYHLKLDVAVPDGAGHSDFELLHGEERNREPGEHPGDLEVRRLMMPVDS